MNLRKDLVLASLIKHLQFVVNRDAWQLLSGANSLPELPDVVARTSNLVSMAHGPRLFIDTR
jgi:hypothetical protein